MVPFSVGGNFRNRYSGSGARKISTKFALYNHKDGMYFARGRNTRRLELSFYDVYVTLAN